MKTLLKRARKKKGPCRLGYVRYKRVSIMRDNRAHAGRWKRLRRANGTLEKRRGSQKMRGATRRRGGRRKTPVVVGGDVVAVVAVDGVAGKARATQLPRRTTRGFQRPPGQRQMAGSVEGASLGGTQTGLGLTGQIDLPGIDRFSCVPSTHIHLIIFISPSHNAKRHPPDLKSPSTPESDKEGP